MKVTYRVGFCKHCDAQYFYQKDKYNLKGKACPMCFVLYLETMHGIRIGNDLLTFEDIPKESIFHVIIMPKNLPAILSDDFYRTDFEDVPIRPAFTGSFPQCINYIKKIQHEKKNKGSNLSNP